MAWAALVAFKASSEAVEEVFKAIAVRLRARLVHQKEASVAAAEMKVAFDRLKETAGWKEASRVMMGFRH